jgi:hypothetical protein
MRKDLVIIRSASLDDHATVFPMILGYIPSYVLSSHNNLCLYQCRSYHSLARGIVMRYIGIECPKDYKAY